MDYLAKTNAAKPTIAIKIINKIPIVKKLLLRFWGVNNSDLCLMVLYNPHNINAETTAAIIVLIIPITYNLMNF